VVAALVVTLLVGLVGGVAYAVQANLQDEQAWRELRYTAEHGDPDAPPGCAWLFTAGQDPARGAPDGFPLRADFAGGSVVERTVERDDTVYLVRTQNRGGQRVQAVFDTRLQLADRRSLLLALAISEVIGLAVAVLAGLIAGRRAVAPLIDALDRQRRFVTDASHELRAPVTQAYTRVQLMMRLAAAADLPDEHRAGLARLAGRIRRFGEVIDDLLLSARLAAHGSAGAPVDLAALAETAVAAEADRADERLLTLTVDRPPAPLLVAGVDSALLRAIGELLANAVEHTPPGGSVRLSVRRAGGCVELTVADTGTGLDPDDRIFDRFHGDGYGLGLSLLREVVASHSGTVEVAGQPGLGARFTIRLPELPAGRVRRPATTRWPRRQPSARLYRVAGRGRPAESPRPARPAASHNPAR
jgi:two-component system, OmpR family, sensor kinase